MADIVKRDERNVASIRKNQVLPPGTVFYEDLLKSEATPPREERDRRRNAWLESALQATAECNVVFLDPDNGLACQAERLRSMAGSDVMSGLSVWCSTAVPAGYFLSSLLTYTTKCCGRGPLPSVRAPGGRTATLK